MTDERTAVVVCADRGVFETLVGLLLSLKALDRRRYQVCIVDTGLTDGQRAHVGSGCDRLEAVRDDLVVLPEPELQRMLDVRIPFWRAQMCRPYLREYFPGFKNYIHIDADIWAQSLTVFDACVAIVDDGKAVIVPEADAAYDFLRSPSANAQYADQRFSLFARFFGEDAARNAGYLPYYNTGFFGLPGNAPHWTVFGELLRAATRNRFHFLVEQAALNLAFFTVGETVLLPATANWMCTLSVPRRGSDGLWRSPVHPNPPIDLIHLSGIDKVERYAPLGLLYDGGRYLDGIAHLTARHPRVG